MLGLGSRGDMMNQSREHTLQQVLEDGGWRMVAFPLSRASSRPRDQTQVSSIAGRFFTKSGSKTVGRKCPGKPSEERHRFKWFLWQEMTYRWVSPVAAFQRE